MVPLINSYCYLYQKSKLQCLKVWRMRTIAIECFKISYERGHSYLQDFIQFKEISYFLKFKTAQKNKILFQSQSHSEIFLLLINSSQTLLVGMKLAVTFALAAIFSKKV